MPTAELNPDQLDAVVHAEGPLLIIAGAGSGKTRVLTHRIAHLIEHEGVSPFRILAITFTNKAADEMRHRVEALVGPVAKKMWVSTFHAACVRILRRDIGALGYPSSFTIYDEADAVRLTGYVLRDLNVDPKRFPPRSVHATISAAKNELILPEEYAAKASSIFERRIADIYREYQSRLQRAGALDFDDLLTLTVRLFNEHPDVLAHYQERFEHILVDEYQDTNRAQNEIVLKLAAVHHNVCVVGDGDQSIYRFRAADIRNILEFEQAFPDVTVITLEQNYRSTQTILDAANAVIANNVGRKPKNLWTDQGIGDPIVRYHADDEGDEAQWVAHQIALLHDEGDRRWGDVAVFYRTNAQSRVLEEHFMRVGIPYKVLGGTRFYDRREIKDAVAYLRAVANPADEVSVKRVVNVPKRGVGDTTIGRVDNWATSHGLSFHDALRRADDAGVSTAAQKGIASFLELLDEARAMLDEGPGSVLELLLEGSGYLKELHVEHSVEAEGRLENLAELVGSAREMASVDDFLEQVSLVSDTDELDGDSGAVVAHDVALGEGPRVPDRLPHRVRRRRVPTHPLARPSPRSSRRSVGSRTSASRGPASDSSSATHGAECCGARRSTTRRAGSSTRSRPSSSRWSTARAGRRVERRCARTIGQMAAGVARASARPQVWRATASSTRRSARASDRRRRAPSGSGCASATTCATRSSAMV